MNSLGTTMLWSAVQVTLVMAFGAVIQRRAAARGGPAAGAFVATLTLGLVIASTLAAFAPRPGWWSWRSLVSNSPATRPEPAARPALAPLPATTAPAAWGQRQAGRSLALLRAFAGWLEPSAARDAAPSRRWPAAVAIVSLAGTVVGLLRLLLGVWAVHDCRRRSRPIDDPDLGALADSLRRQLGCRRPVELREAPDLGCAATVGWRLPMVLLPRDWPGWSAVEARAVLGHELAHIAGAHYLAGLVARLGVALHFYHPLAHWLGERLRLEHELAADAIGARLAGGRAVYLRVLSRMALQQEPRPAYWPARTFLPGRGTLIRRIEMLKDSERSACATAPRGRLRTVMAVPLVVIAVGVSALNGPDRGARAEPPRDDTVVRTKTPAPLERAMSREAFDLAYIPHNAGGLAVVRPAAAFRLAGMAPHAKALKAWLSQVFPESRLPLEGIEQVSTGFYFGKTKQSPDGKRMETLMTGGFMARTVNDFDWKGEAERLLHRLDQGGKLVEQTHAGSVYYRITGVPALGHGGSIYFPDARTVVTYPEADMKRMLEDKGRARPAFVADQDWALVERGVAAVVIDNRRGQLVPTTKEEGPEAAAALTLVENSDRWTLGVVAGERLSLRMIASSESKQAGASIAQAVATLRRLATEELDGRLKASPAKASSADAIRLARALSQQLRVTETPTSVTLRSDAEFSLGDFVSALIAAEGF